jgi:hypothetical protein
VRLPPPEVVRLPPPDVVRLPPPGQEIVVVPPTKVGPPPPDTVRLPPPVLQVVKVFWNCVSTFPALSTAALIATYCPSGRTAEPPGKVASGKKNETFLPLPMMFAGSQVTASWLKPVPSQYFPMLGPLIDSTLTKTNWIPELPSVAVPQIPPLHPESLSQVEAFLSL